jgi:hypothetical protein
MFHHVINERTTTNRFLPLINKGVLILLSNLLMDPQNFQRYMMLYVSWMNQNRCLLQGCLDLSTSDCQEERLINIAYGLEIKSLDDPRLISFDKVVKEVSAAVLPGAWLVVSPCRCTLGRFAQPLPHFI